MQGHQATGSDPGSVFGRFQAYRTRAVRKKTTPLAPERPPPRPATPTLDFHQVISVLGDYPLLLRRLGLIIDLEVKLTSDLPKDSRMQLNVSGGTLPTQEQHWTAYLLTDDAFVPKPKAAAGPGSMHDGVCDLRGVDDSHALNKPNPFEIVQIDVDSAGAKLLNLSAALMRKDLNGPMDQGNAGAPALRSAGLTLLKTDRHLDVARSISDSAKWSQAPDGSLTFFAEDLHRGYRVDVLDLTQGSTWRSLCQRVGTYKLRDGSSIPNVPADEGYIKAASTTSDYSPNPPADAAGANGPHYLRESILRWAGWSLCAPRPGRPLKIQTCQMSPEQRTRPA
jgi:hypothetical protein